MGHTSFNYMKTDAHTTSSYYILSRTHTPAHTHAFTRTHNIAAVRRYYGWQSCRDCALKILPENVKKTEMTGNPHRSVLLVRLQHTALIQHISCIQQSLCETRTEKENNRSVVFSAPSCLPAKFCVLTAATGEIPHNPLQRIQGVAEVGTLLSVSAPSARFPLPPKIKS